MLICIIVFTGVSFWGFFSNNFLLNSDEVMTNVSNCTGELKITEPPSGVTVLEGEEASLKCIVKGDNVNVQWSR